MPTIVREDIDNLNVQITITIDPSEYTPRLDEELSKYKKQAAIRGFRKGKTPKSFLRKMFGKQALADVINQLLQKEMVDFLTNLEEKYLGQPIGSKDQDEVEFDPKSNDPFVFKFDLGLTPDFELQGVGDDHAFTKYVVDFKEDQINQELENARKREGTQEEVESDIQDNDLLTLDVKELDESGAVKEEGLSSSFTILVSTIADEATKGELLGKDLNSIITLDLLKLEKDIDEKFVRKQYLQLPDDSEVEIPAQFEATVSKIMRVIPAEMDEAFFQKFTGDQNITTEEGAKDKIKEDIAKFYNRQAEALLFRDFQDYLMEQNAMDLPDDFLKRWLLVSREDQQNPEVIEAEIEQEYPRFADNLRWTIVKDKITDEFGIEITEEEVNAAFKERIRGYFGAGSPYADDAMLDNMVERLKGDPQQTNQIREELLSDKLYEAIEPQMKVEESNISEEAFKEIAQKAQAEAQALQAGEEEE